MFVAILCLCFTAQTLRMDPSSLPQLSTLLALGYGAAFALDLEEWSFGVVAGGSSVSFDARFAGEDCFLAEWTEGVGKG